MKKRKFFSSYALLFLALCAIVLVGCANENEKLQAPAKSAPANANATALALATNVINGGQTGYLYVTGNGTAVAQNFDGEDYRNTNYTVKSNSVVTFHLTDDTTWVEKLGIDVGLITKPQNINTVDTVNSEKVGKQTTMSSWNLPDGQSIQASILNLRDRTAYEEAKLPHAVAENARFNKVVSVEPSIDGRSAVVTLSLLADVRGENSPSTSGEGTEEILVSYIQAIPEPELKYSWDLAFSTQGTNLVAELSVTSSKGEKWSNPWYAAQIGKYNDLKTLYISTTEVVDKVQSIEEDTSKEKEVAFEQDGANWEMSTFCSKVTDHRFWRSDANGKVGPQMTVFFYTTSVVFTAPTGEKIRVIINQETDFEEDGFSTNEALVGDVKTLPNETTEYIYEKSYTYSANHYVTCTVVDVDGKEATFPIGSLPESGLFRRNACTTNLYTRVME